MDEVKGQLVEPKTGNSAWTDILQSIAIAIILAFLIRWLIIQPFFIPSGSMMPALAPGDRIIVNKFIYRFTEPQPGDIIVFKFPLDQSRDFIKRVIATEGQSLMITNGRVLVNERDLDEPYLPQDLHTSDFGPVEVPQGTVFVMGDNRNNSQDSRVWGPLDRHLIIGKAFVIFWPPGRAGILK